MQTYFTQQDVEYMRKAMSIFAGFNPELIKLENALTENDTLVIGHLDIRIGVGEVKSIMGTINRPIYIIGLTLQYPGTHEEPPTTDHAEGWQLENKQEAFISIVKLWAEQRATDILESVYLEEQAKEPPYSENDF